MTLEEQIEKLQHQLALKKAFASVQFLWDEIPDLPVFTQVEEALRSAALKLAEGVETGIGSNALFTEDEVSALKTLANSVINRSKKPAVSPEQLWDKETLPQGTKAKPATPPPTDGVKGKKASLLYTDNVPKPYRAIAVSEMELMVLEEKGSRYLVTDLKGSQFLIPVDDIEFID